MIVAHMIPSFIPEYDRLPIGDKFSLAGRNQLAKQMVQQKPADYGYTSLLVATVGKSHFTSDTSSHLSSIGHLVCNDKNQYFLLIEYVLERKKSNFVVSQKRETNFTRAQHFDPQFEMT